MVAATDGLVGRVVDGRYRITEKIARGGMATVYAADDDRLGRQVALKVMRPELVENEEFVTRFMTEARSAALLSRHPAIVTLYDQGSTDGLVWIALELVHGRTLRAVLHEHGRVDPATALDVMEPVLTALAAAHGAGIVHRDVKPENILIGDDGRVQVTDFGLSRAVEASPTTTRGATRGVLLGSISYLSPEQALGLQATPRSDVYSAGVVLFELLTGAPPHDGPTDYVIVRKHVEQDVPAPSGHAAGIPASLDALVAGATSRDPQQRFADAQAFLDQLRETRDSLRLPPSRTSRVAALVGASAAGAAARSASAAGATAEVPVLDDGRSAGTGESPPAAAGGRVGTDELPLAEAGTPAGTGELPVMQDGERVGAAAVGAGIGPPEPPPARRRRVWPWLLLLVVLLAAGAGAWYLLEGRWTQTPPMVGMTVAEAEVAAERVGLQVEVTGEAFSETIPADRVATTDPDAGSRVRTEDTVALVLSKGPERYDVPDVVGQTRADAEEALGGRNLLVGEVAERFSETVPQGSVIAQSLEPGASVKRDTPVDLVVSKGRRPIEVPDVTGQPVGQARQAIEAATLAVSVRREFSTDVELGRVISQEPADGTLFRGDEVALVVSNGPPVVDVPSVEGSAATDAEAALRDLGLTPRRVVLLPAGPERVLRQDPTAGTEVRAGSTVTIYIF